MRRAEPGLILALAVTALVARCAPNALPSVTFSIAPSPTAIASASPGATPTAPAMTSSPPSSAAASPIPTDEALLTLLPEKLDGLDRQVDSSVNRSIAGDANLARLARSFATALYIDAATSEFAYVSVVRLQKPLSAEEARSYRDSFDAAACSQAGGLERTAEATIGAHPAYIGTCAGGVRTYHVDLSGGRVIMSVSEAGERRLAERLIGELA